MPSYSEYIFRMPSGTPELDYASLTGLIQHRYGAKYPGDLLTGDHAGIGTTVQLTWVSSGRGSLAWRPSQVEFRLYGLLIARIMPSAVFFPQTNDTHLATTEWLGQIVADNAIGHRVGRIRRHKADGPGPWGPRGECGLLVIDWIRSQPVEGRTYPVGDIAALRTRRAAWAEETRQISERMAAEGAEQTRQFYADLAVRAAGGDKQAQETLFEHGYGHLLDEDTLRALEARYGVARS